MIKPLSNYVVIEPIEEKNENSFGILIPETASKDAPMKGKVISVGRGLKTGFGRIEMEVKEGDQVIFIRYNPFEVKMDGKKLLIAKEEDIMATYSEQE